MVAVKMGGPMPPMGGMPGMMPPAPMPQPPMGAGPMIPPPMPVPPMQPPMPMGQGVAPVPPQGGSNAGRRRRFGDALEGMMSAGRPQVGADQMRNMDMFTGQMMGSTMMTPMSRPSMPPQQPVRRMAQGGLAMGPAPDGFGVYLDGNRLADPSDMHQKMLRAGYGREEIMDSASALRNSAAHIADDLGAYGSGARSGFGHSHYANGGEVLPRETTIAGQPHYLAYINPEEGALLKGLGGAEAPGPGGVPSYFLHTSSARQSWKDAFSGGSSSSSQDNTSSNSNVGSSGYVSLDSIANQAVQNDPKQSFSYMGKSYDNVSDYHNAIFGDNDDSPAPAPTPAPTPPPAPIPSYTDTSNIAGISAASGIDYGGGGSNVTTAPTGVVDFTTIDPTTGTQTPVVSIDYGSGSDDDGYVAPVIVDPVSSTPKPVFYDQFGNEYDTAEEAAAADAAYAQAEAERLAEEERVRKEEELRLAREAQAREDAIAAAQATYQENLAGNLAMNLAGQAGLDKDLTYATRTESLRQQVINDAAAVGIQLSPEDIDREVAKRLTSTNVIAEPATSYGNIQATQVSDTSPTEGVDIFSLTDVRDDPYYDEALSEFVTNTSDSSSEDYTPTAAELASQLAAQGKTSAISGPLSTADQVSELMGSYGQFTPDVLDAGNMAPAKADFPSGPFSTPEMTGLEEFEDDRYAGQFPETTDDFTLSLSDMAKDEMAQNLKNYYTTGAGRDGATQDIFMPPDESFESASADLSALDRLAAATSDQYKDLYPTSAPLSVTVDDGEVVVPQETVTQESKPESQGLGAVDASNYLDRTGLRSTAEAGMDPGAVNAAEARYLQRLMESVDDPNLLDQIVGGLGKALTYGMFDINEFNREKAQEALDAYKDTGKFIYDTEQSNLFYEPIDLKDQEALEKLERLSAGEGQMPAVVGIADADGNRTGFSTAIMNTPDGPLTRDEYAKLVASRQPDDDEPVVVDPCPEGYVLDPETQICVPVEEGVGGEGGEEEGGNLGLNRPRVPLESLDDIMKRIVQVPSAPVAAKTNLPVPMARGGMVGLNRAADNFLAAIGG